MKKRTQISDKGYTLKSLLDEITEKCLQSDLDLLTGIARIHSMYGKLESPAAFSDKLKKEVFTLPPQYFALHKKVETAHHSLIISQDRKIATFRRVTPHCVHTPEALTSHPSPVLRDLMLAGLFGR